MWELYLTLKQGLDTNEPLLIDEVIHLMEKIDTASFKKALRIMYGDDFRKDLSSLEYGLMFIRGIKKSRIFEFQVLMENLNGTR